MGPLRRLPTARLVAACALVVVLGASIAAIAIAAGRGPVPPRRALAVAIHRALAAPDPAGISAQVTLTDRLFPSLTSGGRDGEGGGGPLLNGGSGRLWLDGAGRFRLEIQGDNGDAELVVAGRRAWLSDPASNTVYEATLPAHHAAAHHPAGVPSLATIRKALRQLSADAHVTGPTPGDTAGQPSYSVRITPRGSGGLIGGAALTWDASRGVPLDVAVYARGDSTPVVELAISNVQYGPVGSDVFAITPPAGAKVVRLGTLGGQRGGVATRAKKGKPVKPVSGVRAVSRRLPFRLAAPARLAGLARSEVRLAGPKAALVQYGTGWGAVLVLEQRADAQKPAAAAKLPAGPRGRSASLPTVSIDGVSALELPTPLGTLVRFTRAGVTYTVAGSVPRAQAEAVARGL